MHRSEALRKTSKPGVKATLSDEAQLVHLVTQLSLTTKGYLNMLRQGRFTLTNVDIIPDNGTVPAGHR